MGEDERALLQLWREKRGEVQPEDHSGNLLVQLGAATEDLNRRWYQANTGQIITDVQRQITASGFAVDGSNARWPRGRDLSRIRGQVHAAVVVLGRSGVGQKYLPQLQHNMWVVAARSAVLSVITGGGKWVEITTYADPLYQHLIVTAERKFWRCVENGDPPTLFGVEPPKPRIEAVRIVDMSTSNAWAELAGVFSRNTTGVSGA